MATRLNDRETLFPLNVSSSLLEVVRDCKFKFFRKYCQHLRGRGLSPNPHLYAGGLFASACEVTRKAYYNDRAELDDAIQLGTDLILSADTIQDGVKSNERVALAFHNYMKQFLVHDITPAQLADGTYAIEYAFELDTGIPHPDLPDRNVIYSGRVDFVGVKNTNLGDEYYILDEKTTKSVYRIPGTKLPDIDKIKAEYICRGQFIGYVLACREIGIPVSRTKVRKVPIAMAYEPAFEIDIECNQGMLEYWRDSLLNTIGELVESYKHWKANMDLVNPRALFIPSYGNACCNWGSICEYSVGCTEQCGEEILEVTHEQIVSYPLSQEPITLKEYMASINVADGAF